MSNITCTSKLFTLSNNWFNNRLVWYKVNIGFLKTPDINLKAVSYQHETHNAFLKYFIMHIRNFITTFIRTLLEHSKEVLWPLKLFRYGVYKSYSLDKNSLYKYNNFQTDFLFNIDLSKTNQRLISKLQLYF